MKVKHGFHVFRTIQEKEMGRFPILNPSEILLFCKLRGHPGNEVPSF